MPISEAEHRSVRGTDLPPSRQRSGERDITGGITSAGDTGLRRARCQAATVLLHRDRAS